MKLHEDKSFSHQKECTLWMFLYLAESMFRAIKMK